MTGREYALIGMTFGTAFVDVSSPSVPVYLGELPTSSTFGSTWRDVKTDGDHAFIVSEARRHGMQVFDLTRLRGLDGTSPVTFTEDALYRDVGSAHNIVVNETADMAYVVGAGGRDGCNGGLHMVDISTPTSPTFAGCFGADGYTHDAQCVTYDGPDAEHRGKDICLASNEDTVTIVDVTSPSAPVQLSRTGYDGAEYTHQGWLTEDHAYFLVDDELDEQRLGHTTRTRVLDVADLDAPAFVGHHDAATAAIDHNQYVRGNLTFQANYRAGLRILEITDATTASLTEVGYFDVWPEDDGQGFNGAWSSFPYYASGIVVVSGIEQGLFVLRPALGGGTTGSAPSVVVTSPQADAVVSGDVLVAAEASDADGTVTQVEFIAGGTSIGTDTTAPYEVTWDSLTVTDGQVVISATATDDSGRSSTDTVTVVVDNVADPSTVHVGDLDGTTVSLGNSGRWDALVDVLVVDDVGAAFGGAVVSGAWSTEDTASCTTDAAGWCSVATTNRRSDPEVAFSVADISAGGVTYDATLNQDPDGDSDGTTIVLRAP